MVRGTNDINAQEMSFICLVSRLTESLETKFLTATGILGWSSTESETNRRENDTLRAETQYALGVHAFFRVCLSQGQPLWKVKGPLLQGA